MDRGGARLAPTTTGRRVPLPAYPYERTRHWVDADETTLAAPEVAVSERRLPADRWFAVPTWHQQAPVTVPDLPSSVPAVHGG